MPNMSETKKLKTVGRILDAWLPLKIVHDNVPGLSVGIVSRGKLVYARGFGFADLERRKKTTAETCYRIASISKTFTAIAILQLAEKGEVKLSDPVAKHLNWIKGKNGRVTIKQLLSHAGGMLRDGDTSHWIDDRFPDASRLKKTLARTSLVEGYRSRFKYSNLGFALLGQIIERASGMEYGEYVEKHIIAKIGMKHTRSDLTSDSLRWLAKGYSRFIRNRKRRPFDQIRTNAFASATGFLSNVPDLAKYVSAFSGATDPISKKTQRTMARKLFETGRAKDWYGLGCVVRDIAGHQIVGHAGGFAGFTTRAEVDIKNNLGIIVLSNSIDGASRRISEGVFKWIYGLPNLLAKSAKKEFKDSEEYEGTYRGRWRDTTIVDAGSGLVAFDAQEDSPVDTASVLIPQSAKEFSIRSKDGFENVGENVSIIGNRLLWGRDVSYKLKA